MNPADYADPLLHYGPYAFFPIAFIVIMFAMAVILRYVLGFEFRALYAEREAARKHEHDIIESRVKETQALAQTAERLGALGTTLVNAIERAEKHAERLRDENQ